MMHSPQFQWAFQSATKTYDFEPNFRYLKPYIESADMALVNVETTFGGEPYSGYPNFCSPDAYMESLKEAGWNVFFLANNHILDRGKRGLERTLTVVGDAPNAGAYKTPEDRAARYPLILEKKGVRMAFFNTTYGCNGYSPLPPNVVNMNDTVQILRDLQSIQDSAVDLRIIYIHWGVEYQVKAVAQQRKMAEWLARHFDLIIGGHPHVVEDAEMLGDVPVFYSLGNLISNQRQENSNGGICVRVDIDPATKKLLRLAYLPCYVHKGSISYEQDGEKRTERHYFLLPTSDYLAGKMPFRLTQEEENALRRFDANTRSRLSNFPELKD